MACSHPFPRAGRRHRIKKVMRCVPSESEGVPKNSSVIQAKKAEKRAVNLWEAKPQARCLDNPLIAIILSDDVRVFALTVRM